MRSGPSYSASATRVPCCARAQGVAARHANARRNSLRSIFVQLVPLRLERAADLAVDARLRQRDAALAGHFRNDRHIVLGPGHGLPAPVLERAVGGAAP